MSDYTLEVKNLSISFEQYTKGFKMEVVKPVKNLNIRIKNGEILALVGASGSGKSLLAHAIMGILPNNSSVSGDIIFKGEYLTNAKIEELRGRKIGFIPQSTNYLDPLMRVKNQVQIGLPKAESSNIQEDIFSEYGLRKEDGELFPFELSGGMLRRVLFATSIRSGIELIIADEPTPGIHPEVLDNILLQLKKFSNQGISVLLITHDIISALKIADRVTILKDGDVVESSSAKNFRGNGEALKTQYAKLLWKSLPENEFIDMGECLYARV